MRTGGTSISAVSGRRAHHSAVSTLPRTAVTGAMALRRWRFSGPPMSPAWMMCADPASAARASGRSRPWVSEIRPIGLADVFEADILNGVALPIAVIEVPPLGLEDGE